MRCNRAPGRRRAIVVGVVTLVLLSTGVGLVSAAVSGSFSSSYDGWADGSSTGASGHEIQVTGTIEVSGDSAVSPRIVVRNGSHTVLDQGSVRIFVEGGQTIDFDRSVRDQSVVYRTDELPAGTTLQVEYRAYYIGGAEPGAVTVGTVGIRYETPGGESQRESFSTENQLENRPESVIDDLREDASEGQTLSTGQEILSYVGILAVIYVVLRAGLSLVGGDDDDDIDV